MNILSFLFTRAVLGRIDLNYTDVDTVNPNKIEVNIVVYISNEGRQKYSNRMGDIEDNIDQVREKLTSAFNARADSDPSNKYSRFIFNILIQPESPEGIDLNQCGLSPVDITNHLNLVHDQNPDRHVLLFYNCPSDAYEDQFINANVNYPLISVTDNITCMTRNATFVEPEVTKFELTIANFLTRAAGCPFDNAISITTEDGGDRGVVLNYFIAKDSYDAMFKNRCGNYY